MRQERKVALEKKLTAEVAQGIEFSLDLEWLLAWIADNFDAEDVYSAEHLAAWAESAGYVLGPNEDEDEQRVRY
jgi:hypothetical protein